MARFAVVQERPDGTQKVRPIDNMSWSTHGPSGTKRQKRGSVNGHTVPAEKMSHDTLDTLAMTMKKFVSKVGCVPGLLKADIDAAFRRIPIRPQHRWAYGWC